MKVRLTCHFSRKSGRGGRANLAFRIALLSAEFVVSSERMMKKQFSILKNKPRINIRVTRDSVCAADDVDAPHDQTISLPSFVNPTDFIRELLVHYSLPQIANGSATWTCHLNKNKIAVVAQQWISPKAITTELEFLDDNELHFKYHAQERPENYL